MPVGLFAALVLTVVFQIAEKLDWWIIKENIFEWIEIYEVNHINSIGLFFLMISIAIIIYLYQKWQDEVFKDEIR